jgi:glycosyltransferase involved in cell wall biosynthesis
VKKILIVHNKYLNLGGEDLVVVNETKLLNKRFKVKNIYFQNTSSLDIFDFLSLITGTNRKTLKTIKKEINSFNPDIVYFHNIWYKINTKTVLKATKKINHVLIKQHNLRHECIQGMHFRKNNLCHSCQNSSKVQGIINKCYKNSYLKSLMMTVFSWRYLKLLKNKKIKILTFTDFHSNRLILNNINQEKIHKLNNYIESKEVLDYKLDVPEKFICYVGRVTKEKGTHLVLNAFQKSKLTDTKLLIIGNINNDIDVNVYKNNEKIIFKDLLDNHEVKYLMTKSKAVIMGSIAYEGHPVVLSESIISNTVLIYPSFSGLDELMPKDYDYSYTHNDEDDLTRILDLLDNDKTYERNKSLISKFKIKNYNENVFFEQFENIFI